MGLLVGTVFYPVISETKRHKAVMWIFRIIAIPLAIVLFVLLIRNFYTSDPYAGASSFVGFSRMATNSFLNSMHGLPLSLMHSDCSKQPLQRVSVLIAT
jgi:RsiW-degrading membrane proteinase PrsW (M82 family)